MTSAHSHLDSEELASAAHDALRSGESDRARLLFADAARAEVDAFESVAEDKPRTLGILAVSATALFFKADECDAAEQLARRALANAALPAFAQRELQELLEAIAARQA